MQMQKCLSGEEDLCTMVIFISAERLYCVIEVEEWKFASGIA